MSTLENKALAQRYYQELLNGGDLSFIDRYMAAEFEFTNPTHPHPYRGQQFKELVAMLHSAFPDIHFTVERLVAEADIVVGRWNASGTHTGTPLNTLLGDIPAQGKAFSICGMSWLRIVDGQFVAARVLEDTLGLIQQLGFPSAWGISTSTESTVSFDSDPNNSTSHFDITVREGLHVSLLPPGLTFAWI